MSSLADLFAKGTGQRCDKWQHYIEIYERYFSKFVGTKCTYLELGVAKGGSLQLMQDYLGTEARIIGVDIDPECEKLREEGREIYIGDQSDDTLLDALTQNCAPFDIILDDGSHIPDHQIQSFMRLFPLLKEGGVYVVEDLHTAFWYGYQDSRFGLNFYDFAKGLADKLSLYHVDHRLIVRYKQPREERTGYVAINNFATTDIFGIHFYDSIAVFEKRRRIEPYSELR